MAITAKLDAGDGQLIDELVDAGRYASADEVVRRGLTLVRQEERQRAELHAALDAGLADLDAGRTKPADEVFDRLIAKYEAMAAQAGQ